MSERNILLRRQFRSFGGTQPDGRRVCLKSRDGSWLPSLADHVNCLKKSAISMLVMVSNVREMLYLANTDGDREGIQVSIQGDQEPGIHRGDQEVEHPVILIEYDCSIWLVSI